MVIATIRGHRPPDPTVTGRSSLVAHSAFILIEGAPERRVCSMFYCIFIRDFWETQCKIIFGVFINLGFVYHRKNIESEINDDSDSATKKHTFRQKYYRRTRPQADLDSNLKGVPVPYRT